LTPWILMMIIEKSLVFVLVTSNPNRIESIHHFWGNFPLGIEQ
jgi:hypothetical protein